MRVGRALFILFALTLPLAGCDSASPKGLPDHTTSGTTHLGTAPSATSKGTPASPSGTAGGAEGDLSLRNANSQGPAVTDPEGLACVDALRASGVDTSHLSDFPQSGMVPGGTSARSAITLAASLTSGPVPVHPGQASGIQTATWNLLSTAGGRPLTPYLGQTLYEVILDNWGSLRIGDYICFEQDAKVVGLMAQQPNYSFQPMQDVAVDGKTVTDLTGNTYLQWLESVGAYVPTPTPNSPQLDAEGVLLDFFAALNADLTSAQRAKFGEDLTLRSSYGNYLVLQSKFMRELVPTLVTPYMGLEGTGVDTPLHQAFSVHLWPAFRHFSMGDLAGNGEVEMVYEVDRPSTSSPWKVTGAATGG